MTKKNARKIAARASQTSEGGKYQSQIRSIEKVQRIAATGKITSMPRGATGDFSTHVAEVLSALGHPEAFVTDESTVGHFEEFGGRPHCKKSKGKWTTVPGDPKVAVRNKEKLAKLEEVFGFPIGENDRIVEVARKIKVRGRS